jgi:signal transduction histidine kinase
VDAAAEAIAGRSAAEVVGRAATDALSGWDLVASRVAVARRGRGAGGRRRAAGCCRRRPRPRDRREPGAAPPRGRPRPSPAGDREPGRQRAQVLAGAGSVAVCEREISARFTVADEGPGIPAGDRERVFEKFFRLDPGQQSGVGGTGLGLYIARELVHRMGGRIGYLARDHGAAFYVDVPVAA